MHANTNKEHNTAPGFLTFLLGVLTGILYFPITYLCLASHATPLLHKMISLFMHVHESQFIQVYFLSLLKLHQMKKMVSSVYYFQAFTSQKSVFIKDYTRTEKQTPAISLTQGITMCPQHAE